VQSIIAGIYAPAGLLYGIIKVNIIISILYTNPDETAEFVSGIPLYVYVLIITLILFTYINVLLRKHLVTKKPNNYKILLGIFIMHSVFYGIVKPPKNKPFNNGLIYAQYSRNFIISTPFKAVNAYQTAQKSIAKYEQIQHLISDFNPSKKDDDNPKMATYVVLIGESARRDSMQNYGFYLQNTPFLAQVPRIQFNNYLSAGPSTALSLQNMLTLDNPNYPQNPYKQNPANNVISLAKKAGFYTYFLSNQANLGIHDSVIGAIGKTADYSRFLNKTTLTGEKTYKNDDVLIPVIKQAINEDKDSKVIVVHLLGSHYDFCKRTFDKYGDFVSSKEISCYIQSIKNTDTFLAQIYDLLQSNKQQTGKNWALVYFSDHGLSAEKGNPNNLFHSDKHKINYEVPFVILDSLMTETKFINKRRTGLHFMEFFADWLKVSDQIINHQCNFLADEECPNPNLVIDFDNQPSDYSKLQNEPINYLYPQNQN